MIRSVVVTLAVVSSLVGGDAVAVNFGDPAAGEEKAKPCAACHGEAGAANPTFPTITGQYADYLLHALKAYKSGDRKNAVMAGQVANLSPEDMEDLAAYFATQEQGGLHVLER